MTSHFKFTIFCFLQFALMAMCRPATVCAQTIYVDAVHGKETGKGTSAKPFKSLEKAIAATNQFKGHEPVRVILSPGLYSFNSILKIKTAAPNSDLPYTIEAKYNPNDAGWDPSKMPVIQSLSDNNMSDEFSHAVGLLVLKNNVHIQGIKFVGDANPNVGYYYAIRRPDGKLNGISLSQCYFIGEKNSAAIQSALWISGPGIRTDHCIFYNCRNAFVLGGDISGFSLTYSIVYGAYEAALWYRGRGSDFTFSHNIITGCNYLMVHEQNNQPGYTVSDSYICGNNHYLGFYPPAQDSYTPVANTKIKEVNIHKSGKIQLVPVKLFGITKDNLELSSTSDGRETGAGIFIANHN